MKNTNKNTLLYTLTIITIIVILIFFVTSYSSRKIVFFTQPTSPNPTLVATTSLATTSLASATTSSSIEPVTPEPNRYKFLEVMESCGIHSEGACVNMRSGPGKKFPKVLGLRKGIVLSVEKTIKDSDGIEWHKVQFVNRLTYPERVEGDLYVATSVVRTFYDEGSMTKIDKTAGPIKKKIVVNVSEQMLYAYDDGVLFMKESVSTGLKDTPTEVGSYSIFKKTPSRYMQGSADGQADQYYDLPGVPWNLYFTAGGDVIHGAYWHNSFGKQWSHGCVNMEPQQAKKLYEWAVVGTPVIVTK